MIGQYLGQCIEVGSDKVAPDDLVGSRDTLKVLSRLDEHLVGLGDWQWTNNASRVNSL